MLSENILIVAGLVVGAVVVHYLALGILILFAVTGP